MNQKEILITVIVAVRNAQKFISETLDCLKKQTYKNFELIIVDGKSTDNTLNIIKEYNEIINQLLSEPDKGIADAWNKGIKLAKGKFILLLNAGDLIHPKHLERFKSSYDTNNEYSFYFCNVQKFNEKGNLTTLIKGKTPTLKTIRKGSVGFAHPGCITNSQIFKNIGYFNSEIKIAIDTDFILRCIRKEIKFRKFESIAYMSEGGISDKYFKKAIAEYYNSATENNLISRNQAAFYIHALPIARIIIQFSRKNIFPLLRSLKHTIVSVANIIENILPIKYIRKIFFSILNFKIGKNSSIGIGFSFYRTGNISIGCNSVINRDCLFDNRGYISIGDNVSISRNTSIFTAGHDVDSPFFEMLISKVSIKSNAVIFSNVIIMPGVTIGEGAVIYPGSVVTSDIPSMAIAAGIPARTIRMRLSTPKYKLNYQYPLAM